MDLTANEHAVFDVLRRLDEQAGERCLLWHIKDVASRAQLSKKIAYDTLRALAAKGLTEMGPYPHFRISETGEEQTDALLGSVPVRPGVRCRLSALAERLPALAV